MTNVIQYIFIVALLHSISFELASAQSKYDSSVVDNSSLIKVMCYPFKDETFIYRSPKAFSFITQLPKTFSSSAKMTFRKESIPALAALAGSTIILIAVDQHINDGVQQFGRYIHLDADRDYKTLISFKLGGSKIPVYELPRNTNSAIYSIGEGFTSIVISGAFFTYGKITHDYRAAQTASQILQAQLAVGSVTQTIKRISGRESPFNATSSGGVWRPFPSLSNYQNHTSHYDAFPSGHLATMMATVTIIADNYPEKRWIRPTGYGIISLVCFSMINNGVHWAGDYPLALGIGYLYGKVTVRANRWVQNTKKGNKNHAE
jgi:membrane-associated phospholipid phosphatase